MSHVILYSRVTVTVGSALNQRHYIHLKQENHFSAILGQILVSTNQLLHQVDGFHRADLRLNCNANWTRTYNAHWCTLSTSAKTKTKTKTQIGRALATPTGAPMSPPSQRQRQKWQIGRALATPTGAPWVESANNDLEFGHQLHRDGFSVISSDGN